jgi:hypothetical protein
MIANVATSQNWKKNTDRHVYNRQFRTRRSLRHRMGWKTSAASNSLVNGNECTATTMLSVIVPLTWDLKRGKLSRHQIFNIMHQHGSAFKPWCAWRDSVYYTSLNSVPNAQVCVFDGTYYKMMLNDVGVHDTACGWMDEWKKLHDKRPRRPLLYVIVLTKLCQSLLPHLCWAISRQWDVFSF